MDPSTLTIIFLSLALFTTILGLMETDAERSRWARNPWGIPVLIAVIFGIIQERSPPQ